MNDRQACTQKTILNSRRGSNPQPTDDRWDALTIEIPRLRWWAKVQFDIYVRPKRKPLSPSGAQNRFLSTGLDDHSSLLRYIQALTFLKQKLHRQIIMTKINTFAHEIDGRQSNNIPTEQRQSEQSTHGSLKQQRLQSKIGAKIYIFMKRSVSSDYRLRTEQFLLQSKTNQGLLATLKNGNIEQMYPGMTQKNWCFKVKKNKSWLSSSR